MIFQETPLKGAHIISPPLADECGIFARIWCRREFAAHAIVPGLAQCNIFFNHKKGTLRGMHYQVAPHVEAKLGRCTAGAVYDVTVDVGADSKTFKQWFVVELSSDTRRMPYIPDGLTHGFQTLTDGVEVFRQMSEFDVPECARGVRWNDPVFGTSWPLEVVMTSERDRTYPDFVS